VDREGGDDTWMQGGGNVARGGSVPGSLLRWSRWVPDYKYGKWLPNLELICTMTSVWWLSTLFTAVAVEVDKHLSEVVELDEW